MQDNMITEWQMFYARVENGAETYLWVPDALWFWKPQPREFSHEIEKNVL